MANSDAMPSEIMADDGASTSQSVASLVVAEDQETSDKSKRVILKPANCVVILNGQKCQLKINPENGVLMAYPLKSEEEGELMTTNTLLEDRDMLTGSADSVETDLLEQQMLSTAAQEPAAEHYVDESGAEPNITILDSNQLQHDEDVEFIVHSVPESEEPSSEVINEEAGTQQTVLVDTTRVGDHLYVTSPPAEELAAQTELVTYEDNKDKLPVPELIIPSVGGEMTSLAITQEQVTSVTKVDTSTLIASSQDKDDIIEDVFNPELTITTNVKPVLKQFLISPSVSGNDGGSIGIKTSGQDLKKLFCSDCNFQAYYPHQYENHLKELHAADLHKCKCCGFVTLVEADLTKHYTELHPRNICELCNFVSEYGYVIKRHMYRHSAEGCTCDICGKTYKDQYILKMHVKMVHNPADVLYQCDICSKRFTRKAHLKRHARTHSADKAFACPKCDYRGCERSDVTKHMLIHEAPKLVCEICGKTFRHQKNKDLHMKRHSGQRDFKCGICDFFGYTFTDIRKHIERRHTEWKNTICDKCGARCRSNAALQEHMKTWHSNVQMITTTTGTGSDAVIFVEGDGAQPSQLNENTLIINADGTVMPSEQQEQVVVSKATVGEESVVEFTTSDMDVTELGQDHFTITHFNAKSAVSSTEGVTEIGDLSIDMPQ